jgi:hypothetical protein
VQNYDDETLEVIKFHSNLFDEVILSKENVGAVVGIMYALDRAVQRYSKSNYLMMLEDDWESHESLGKYLDDILSFLNSTSSIGYIRLRTIHQRVSNKSPIDKQGIRYIPVDDLIYRGNMHFTTNPIIFRRKIFDQFKEYDMTKEYHMVEVCHLLGECGAQLRRDCFWHIGLSQRTRPWRP